MSLQKAEWEARWHWKYMVQKEPYDQEAKEYLTQKALKLSEARWQALEESQREDLLSKELWVKENCNVGHSEHLYTYFILAVAHTISQRVKRL